MLWGIIPGTIRFFGPVEPGAPFFPMGTDQLGRCLFSRIVYGTRVSLSFGIISVFFTLIIGLTLGGISGYIGGIVDDIIQRAIDLILSIPGIPLWMALAAALPRDWDPLMIYFGMIMIMSLIGWTGLARVVRGKILSVREEDFTMAARLCGASDARIITKHMLPSFASWIIVSVTMSIPASILGETALSFLGLGLQPPVVSWGVLLQDAQTVQALALQPWLLWPVAFVIITVLAFNFLGDGLRDAADPYAR
jgi:peptide/nickel transport system permease protein